MSHAPSIGRLGLLLRTVRHLKPVQVANRLSRRLVHLRPSGRPAPPTFEGWVYATDFIDRPASLLEDGQVLFLNERGSITHAASWNDPARTKLWLYNLHYFDGLLAPHVEPVAMRALMRRWARENPPFAGNGWEPYPLSLRIVNWIKFALRGNRLPPDIDASLAEQVRALIPQLEYHLLGNHLFANAKALTFAGAYFEGEEAGRWAEQGLAILRREVTEQFLPDGGHFERSTTYHATLLEDLLDILLIMRARGWSLPRHWLEVAELALAWCRVMCRPDGLFPLFNDAAYGVSPTYAQLLGHARALGLAEPRPPSEPVHDLRASGYFRLRSGDGLLFGDAGEIGPDYLPGHAHCDTLGFELFAGGRPVIVDTGTSIYEVGARRHHERSTAAHNTVQVAGAEQSEIWAGFRVGRRARIVERHVGERSISAAHDGYARLGVIHRRRFECVEHGFLIRDSLVGKAMPGRAAFHLHPSIEARIAGDVTRAGPITFAFRNARRVNVEPYEYAPEFNVRKLASRISVEFDGSLETCITVTLPAA